MPNFTKIRPVRAELLHAGGRADRQTDDEDNSSFPQFCERAYKCYAKNTTTIKTQTHSSLTDPFLTYPFPILRSLSSHSTITIYISSSPSPGPSSQWPVDGRPTPIVVFCHYGRVKVSQPLSEISQFHVFEKPGSSGVPNQILRCTGKRALTTYKR